MDLLAELEAAFGTSSGEEGPLPSAAHRETPPAKRRRVQPPPAQRDDAPGPSRQPAPCRPAGQPQRSAACAGQTCSAAAAAAPPPSSSPLLSLSTDLLMRVLGKCAPDELLALSQTSRHMRAAASDTALWRQLYHARWPDGPQQEDAEHVQGATWKVLYLERDHQAVLEAQRSAPNEALLPIYLQMATARRSEPLSSAAAEGLYLSPSTTASAQLSSKVDAYRRRHGLTDAGKHAAHSCRGGCTWSQLGHDAWICDKSGFVHVCNAECAFREPDPSSDLQVCTISGRCFPIMLTHGEEHAGEWERGQSRQQGDADDDLWGGEEGISGRLGRAFYAGYTAETPRDFFRRFGVRF